ncbi:FMN-binding glutamate synthase family protein [Capsulimonas corticalis]|uniref:FMN-binding glutamate synthase family protein n=1 Tax=Capsulimonas corticalis TaxID=2219043 RepID=A0A402CPW6_9BACT|nr:FMN-binding glutamate synthase family protein [Capsulimonas corticalis]BDI32955.1 FMN-binding glutamate synthase family protein [Capsulimonas corticalis]
MPIDDATPSHVWDPAAIHDIQEKARLGRYRIRAFSTARRLPSLEDLTFLPAGLTRVALEGYRETCSTKVTLGTRFASKPLELETPITISGMSYGALSRNAKEALGLAATRVGTSTCTGDGGMHPTDREYSKTLVYQCLPSRYGFNPHDLKRADAIEIVVGQGAKPGTGGLLLGQKVSPEIAAMRDLPNGVDQRSPCRHPDWMGPEDLAIKIEELREATNWEKPIYVKLGAARVYEDVKLAAKAGADCVMVDGMEGGTAASPDVLLDHTGVPTLAAICEAVRALEDLDLVGEVQLIVAGGIKSGVDAAKAIALGADAVAIGTAAIIALNCNAPLYLDDYIALGTMAGACHHCHTGRCPVGVATQDPELMARLPVEEAAERAENFLRAMTLELQMMARACGKSYVKNLDRDDLRALTLESALMTGLPLAGMRHPLTMASVGGH